MAMRLRSKRVTDPLDDRVKDRIVGRDRPEYGSSGSEHSGSGDVSSSSSLSYLLNCFDVKEEEDETENDVNGEDDQLDGIDQSQNNDSDSDLEAKFEAIISTLLNLNLDRFQNVLQTNVLKAREAFQFLNPNSQILNRNVMLFLRNLGYNAAICKTKWNSSGGLAAGSHEFIDVLRSDSVRYFIDLNFSGEFEIARETSQFRRFSQKLPAVFVGKSADLKTIVKSMSDEIRRSLKSRGLLLPPWRKNRFMQNKWFGPYRRTVNYTPANLLSAFPVPVKNSVNCSLIGFNVVDSAPLLPAATRMNKTLPPTPHTRDEYMALKSRTEPGPYWDPYVLYGAVNDTGYPVSEPEPAVPGPVPKYEEPVQPVPLEGRWSVRNVLNLLRILRCFHLSSGLKANLVKTSLMGIGVEPSEVSSLASRLNCKAGQLPFNFLGVPTFKWKSSMLSSAGRMTLCKTVLGSLGSYIFSLYKAPAAVLDKLESIRRNFFYGGDENKKKLAWISWNDTMAEKDQGGLGIGRLKAFICVCFGEKLGAISSSLRSRNLHRGALGEIAAKPVGLAQGKIEQREARKRIKKENDSLWAKVVVALHRFHRRTARDPLLSKKGGVWGSIASINKCCTQYNLNLDLLFQQEDNEQRGWKRLLDPSGSYLVASLRKALDQKMLQNSRGLKTTWIKVVPNKVNVMVWKAKHCRLATFNNLAKRGVIPESRSCPLCSREEETEDHLFANCHVSRSLLTEIGKWWNLSPPCGSLVDILNWGLTSNMKGDKLQIFSAIIYTFFWQVWRTRNEIVHDKNRSSLHQMFILIQGFSFSWLIARGNRKFSWQN
ncbi:hypothetical protein OSB04_020522 [Centaurea solstitialis]|uniref:Reverse transcriptase zinc-binding domain-containing protein n=1 Tax=Centaurea solstitialis TaxID=347529 RepID=A0AA38SSE2_9ASTR|nr:hypothetical protein OSB04_020522 [Centaurea solstitialis]